MMTRSLLRRSTKGVRWAWKWNLVAIRTLRALSARTKIARSIACSTRAPVAARPFVPRTRRKQGARRDVGRTGREFWNRPCGRPDWPVLGLTAWWLGQAASARPHTPLDHHTKQQLLRIGSRARSSHRATKLLSIARNSSAVWSHSCALVGSIGRRPARPLLRTRDDRPMAGPICRLSVLAAIVEGTRALCRRHCRHASRVLVCSSPVFRHGSFAASIRFFQTSGNPAVCAKMFLWRF